MKQVLFLSSMLVSIERVFLIKDVKSEKELITKYD